MELSPKGDRIIFKGISLSKIEGEFNFLVNCFLFRFTFKGISYVKLKTISILVGIVTNKFFRDFYYKMEGDYKFWWKWRKVTFFWFLHSYNEYGRSVDLAGTNSLRGPTQFTQRGAERRVSGWDGMGWDGVSKVSFNFLYTLWV